MMRTRHQAAPLWLAASALALGATLGAGTAAAQGGPGGGMGGGPGGGQGMMQRLAVVDSDGDGLISPEELRRWRESVFYAMDADRDDALTRAEYMAVQLGRGAAADQRGPRYAEMQAAKEADYDAMDTDRDDRVSHEQFVTYAEDAFAAADANGDGLLSAPEFAAMHRR